MIAIFLLSRIIEAMTRPHDQVTMMDELYVLLLASIASGIAMFIFLVVRALFKKP